MKEYRLINSSIYRIVEEESMRMHRCIERSYSRKAVYEFIRDNKIHSIQDYSIVVISNSLGICMISLSDWLQLLPESPWY